MSLDMEIRKKGIGSSEVAAVVGLNPWTSPFDVWLEKTGQAEPFAGNEATEWGKILEPEILKRYQARTGKTLFEPDKTYVHKDRPWQLATPDALVPDEARIVEAKDVGFRMAGGWGEEGSDAVPAYYLTQVAWQMSTLEWETADVAALIDRKLRIYPVGRDKELEEMLLDKVERFWTKHVQAGVPPEITDTNRTRDWLKKKYASHTELLRPATEQETLMMGMLQNARRQKNSYKSVEETLELRLQASIGSDYGIAGDGFKCTWKLDKGKREYTVKAQEPRRVFRPVWEQD